jgi:hypothetical protein
MPWHFLIYNKQSYGDIPIKKYKRQSISVIPGIETI